MGMPDQRKCLDRDQGGCGEWKHHSRFHSWKDKRRSNSNVAVVFSPKCRDCEQRERNEKKNADRPLAIIRQRAASAATKAGATTEFFWNDMKYKTLVPYMRAMMSPEGLCHGCGHEFLNERDIQLEHREPPRFQKDWARLCAENIALACASCNRKKGTKSFPVWLDDNEAARISNLEQPSVAPEEPLELDLFGQPIAPKGRTNVNGYSRRQSIPSMPPHL